MHREAHFVQNVIMKDEWADEFVYAIVADTGNGRVCTLGESVGARG